MINQKVESEGMFSSDAKSESVQGKKKLKKVRSIRLLRFPSMRSSISIGGEGKSLYEHLYMISPLATETSSNQLHASPNYMKGTSSSHAKESLQVTQSLITDKTLTRMYTVKLKRNVTRKLSGRTELKRKLKSSRSIKLATVKSQNSTRKLNESESVASDAQQQSTYAGNKSQRFMTRRLSMKPVRILTKMPTFKSKNESGLHKATCSSTLKDSHFPDHIDLPQEEDGSEGVPVMKKVCRYTYCSLHGHHGHGHEDSPPLKRFVSIRRRQLKTQKSAKIDGRTVSRSMQTGNARKATQKTQNVNSGDSKSRFQNAKIEARDSCVRPHETLESTVTEGSSTSEGEDEERYHISYDDSEVLMSETSFLDMEKDKSDSVVSETARNHMTKAACEKNDGSVIAESTSIDVVKSSASDIERLEGDATTKGINIEQDNEVTLMNSVQKHPKPACTTDVAYRMPETDQKYITKWHLMYKHVILSNTGKEKDKHLFDGKDQERRGQDSHSFDDEKNSCQDYCEADQDMDDENKNVIDLVQRAFDEILLSEPEDFSSDDGFKSRGIGSNEALVEKSEGDRVEQNTLASIESPKEESSLKGDNLRSHVDEITSQGMETKPEAKTPKRWSNLKKLILLKRFVKALEKVRNFNLQRRRHLPSDSNLEGEIVFLKHQTAEEKRNAEEWMLDHALQKVISRLAPAQRQKVALLVEAFETILPFQDADNALQSSAKAETQANRTQSLDESWDHGYSAKILLGKALRSHKSVVEFADNASDNPMPELHKPMVFNERCLDNPGVEMVNNTPNNGPTDEDLNGKSSLTSSYDNGEKISTDSDNIHLAQIKDFRSCFSSSPPENVGSCHEEAPTNEVVSEVPVDLKSTMNAEIPNSKPESPGTDFETKNMVSADGEQISATKSLILKGLARSLGSNFIGSGAPSDQLSEPKADRSESGGFNTHDQSEARKSSVVVEPETKIEKQNNTGLWYLVYKHMVSDTAKDGPTTLIDGEGEAESCNEGSRAGGTSNQGVEDHGVADPEVELRQLEAIKMVEDAIDSILPDDQDQLPDRQILDDNTITDNCSKQPNRADRESSEGLNLKEEKTASGNGITEEQEEAVRKEGNKSNHQLPRSWSNLRKVILLRRFIKALEKVRKFNPRGPRYLPIEPDAEAEKVNLRHQNMAERKGTEEWMLDYALRQVVSKLTPERKRKVGLLVEAFETVMPTFKN